MKKLWIRLTALAAAALALSGATALAADSVRVNVESAYSADIAATVSDGKILLSYSKAVSGAQYVVTVQSNDTDVVPTADNLLYIDQAAATADGVSFQIPYRNLTAGSTYPIYLSSSAESGITEYTKVATYASRSADAKIGDPNGDGAVDVDDALMVLQYTVNVGRDRFTDDVTEAADVDGNGAVDVDDALWILRYTVNDPDAKALID